eukprot:jgi/Chrzof1/14674/Cz09g11190.t1
MPVMLDISANRCTDPGFGNTVGTRLEGVFSADVDGGLFSAFAQRGDVKMTNVGHDHINDDCSSLYGIRMCYAGGFGYHAYNRQGNPRRARVIEVTPDGAVTTWKRLDKWSTPSYASIDQETFSIAVTPDPPVTPKPQSNKRKNEDDNEEDNSDRRKRGGRN